MWEGGEGRGGEGERMKERGKKRGRGEGGGREEGSTCMLAEGGNEGGRDNEGGKGETVREGRERGGGGEGGLGEERFELTDLVPVEAGKDLCDTSRHHQKEDEGRVDEVKDIGTQRSG